MAHLEWWKFATDLLLMGSLIMLCMRFARTPQTAKLSQQTADLEQSLRTLIRDADDAGQALNAQLRNRQDALEKVLAELEGAERRARKLVGELTATEREAVHARPTRSSTENIVSEEPLVDEPEPPSFDSRSLKTRTRPPSPRLADKIERTTPTAAPASENIYGDPLPQRASRAREMSPSPRPVSHSIMRETADTEDAAPPVAVPEVRPVQAQVKPSAADPMDEVYRAAEQMLRTGKDLHYVSSRTEIPIEEVRVLKQIILREQAAAAARLATESMRGAGAEETSEPEETTLVVRDDPRLGVLTAARRPPQSSVS